ncbi:Endonuclease-reverse transcriptase [Operophtera brumata]|uniref:Endonuclease-reverse transcriptase n=1 Tax=Operophtera brumata TaxID=104452 RepID=A0A0L7LC08_OPEBR|nr:Endonuclease-reverse transcriptase [Operophtera brumata]
MGDFNAQVGTKQRKEEFVLGKFGQGKRSQNGELLVEFLMEHNLTLLNSMYLKNKKNKWTWISPDGSIKIEIDYITTNYPKAFTDTSVLSKFNFNTDLRILRSSLRIEPPRKSRKYVASSKTEHYSKETLDKIGQSLIEIAEEITDNSNSDALTKYGKLEKLLTQLKCENSRANKYSLSDTILQLIEMRKNLLSKHPKKENIKAVTELSKGIRKNIKKDRKTKRLQTIEGHIKKTGGVKKALKELRETNKEWIPKLNKKGKTSTNRKVINEIATKFYLK